MVGEVGIMLPRNLQNGMKDETSSRRPGGKLMLNSS